MKVKNIIAKNIAEEEDEELSFVFLGNIQSMLWYTSSREFEDVNKTACTP